MDIGKERIIDLERSVSELENELKMKDDDLNESNKVNEDMISSLIIHLTNKSKCVKQLKTVRKKITKKFKSY